MKAATAFLVFALLTGTAALAVHVAVLLEHPMATPGRHILAAGLHAGQSFCAMVAFSAVAGDSVLKQGRDAGLSWGGAFALTICAWLFAAALAGVSYWMWVREKDFDPAEQAGREGAPRGTGRADGGKVDGGTGVSSSSAGAAPAAAAQPAAPVVSMDTMV
jgi:hypothetical protein